MELNIPLLQTVTYHCLADVALWGGEYKVAGAHYTQSIQLAYKGGEVANMLSALEGLAMTLAAQGCAETALHLAGFVAAQRTSLGSKATLDWWEEGKGRWLGQARKALGAEASERAWIAGRSMPLEQAIAYVNDAEINS